MHRCELRDINRRQCTKEAGHFGGCNFSSEPEKTAAPRTCRNCACAFKIERPAIMPAGMSPKAYDALPREQWVCRLDPPYPVDTGKGMALMQKPTNPDSVCWHWVPEGTLPGDKAPALK